MRSLCVSHLYMWWEKKERRGKFKINLHLLVSIQSYKCIWIYRFGEQENPESFAFYEWKANFHIKINDACESHSLLVSLSSNFKLKTH